MEQKDRPDTEHHGSHDGSHHAGAHAGHHEGVSRRTLLVLAGTAVIAAAIPSALFLSGPETGAARATDFMSLLVDPRSAAHIGNLWFEKSAPGEALPVYETRLLRKLEAQGWREGMDAAETHRLLARAVRADYAANRMVAVDEWHLSETEASLAALAALALRSPSHGGGHGDERGGEHGEDAASQDTHG